MPSFSSTLLKSLITITLSPERFQNFSTKVSEKFDLVSNWAVIGELMSLPVAKMSNLQLSPQLLGFSVYQ